MKRKKITKYNVGGNTGGAAAIGASALSGVLGGASMGPIGMLGGGLLGAYNAFAGQKAEQDILRKQEEDAARAEELRLAEEQRAKRLTNQQILDQYPVEGTYTPRFDGGGSTPGGELPTPPNGRRWNLSDLFRTLPQSKDLIFDPEIQQAYASMSDEELQKLIGTAVPMIDQIRGTEGLGDKIDVVRNADLSWVKPLREKAGLSKNELIDKAVDAGMLKKWAALPVKGAAAFMDFEKGGDTNPSTYVIGSGTSDTIPNNQYFRLNEPLGPNMPIGGRMFGNGYGRWFQPEDSPNGEIRQWDPSMWDYIQQAMINTRNPLTVLADSDFLQRTGDRTGDSFADYNWTRQGLKRMEQKANTDPNDIFPDWVYGLAGIEKKAYGGPTGPRYEAEGGEMIQYKPGDTPAVYGNGGVSMKTGTEGEITGPSHAQGGVDMSDEKGARIYSNKLTVDPALMAKLSKL